MAKRRSPQARPSAPPQTAVLVAKVGTATALAAGLFACGPKPRPSDPPQVQQMSPPPQLPAEHAPPIPPQAPPVPDAAVPEKAPQQPGPPPTIAPGALLRKQQRLRQIPLRARKARPQMTAAVEPLVDPFDAVAITPLPRRTR